jgi:hypothetical protein
MEKYRFEKIIAFFVIGIMFIGAVFSAEFHYANEIVPSAFQIGDYSFSPN